MEFWNSLIIERCEDILSNLNKKFKFILVDEWAVYLWTNLHKSKDIGIIIKNFEDLSTLKRKYNLVKNDNLKKYEIKFEEIDLDIYVPYFSKLAIPVEDIKEFTTKIENVEVVVPEVLLILKQGAELDRKDSVKGNKDRIDILALLFYTEVDFGKYKKLLKKYKLEHFLDRLISIVGNFREIKYLGLNPREFKLRKKTVLEKIKF